MLCDCMCVFTDALTHMLLGSCQREHVFISPQFEESEEEEEDEGEKIEFEVC